MNVTLFGNRVPRRSARSLAFGLLFFGLTALPALAQDDDDPFAPCIEAAEARDWDAVVEICPAMLIDPEAEAHESYDLMLQNVDYGYQALCTEAATASDWNKTLRACGPALEAYPEFFTFHLFLGMAHESGGENLMEAAESYQAFLEGAANNPEMAAQLGDQIALAERNTALLLLRLEDQEAAIPFLRKAIARNPEDSELHFRLGFALLQQGNTEGAEEEFSVVIDQAPDIPQLGNVTFLAGQINYNARNDDRAADQLGKYVRLYPEGEHTVDSRWMLGYIALRNENDSDAIPHFRAFLEVAPDGDSRIVEANYLLGTITFQRNQCDTAQRYYQRFLRLTPNDPRAAEVREILLDIEDGLCEPGV